MHKVHCMVCGTTAIQHEDYAPGDMCLTCWNAHLERTVKDVDIWKMILSGITTILACVLLLRWLLFT